MSKIVARVRAGLVLRTCSYDSLARPSTVVVRAEGTTTNYTTTSTYDSWGRPLTTQAQRDGGLLKTFTTGYNPMGFAQSLTNAAGKVLWTSTRQDAADREVTASYGNSTGIARTYDPNTGRLSASTLRVGTAGQVRFQEVNTYDVIGNMSTRTGQWDPGLADTHEYSDVFAYDKLNRVTTAQAWTQPVEVFQYNEIGNILSKTSTANGGLYDYGNYGATAVRPHAVKSIGGLGLYQYDANGNMTSAPNASTMSWTSFDMPLVITKGTNTDTFVYGPNHERVKLTRNDGTSTYYAGMMETVIDAASNVTVKTYWPGGLGVDIDKGGTTKTYWTPKDRLGSVMAYVDQTSAVVEQMDYDAWGRRRNTTGIGIPDTLTGFTDDKGFTGQEMLDNVQLVHLNGRVYDPLIGRFLSADPEVQAPEHSQSYNRYTYVWNNPTNMTDPTGFETCTSGSVCSGGTGSNIPGGPAAHKGEAVDMPGGGKVMMTAERNEQLHQHENKLLAAAPSAQTQNSTVATGGSGSKPTTASNQESASKGDAKEGTFSKVLNYIAHPFSSQDPSTESYDAGTRQILGGPCDFGPACAGREAIVGELSNAWQGLAHSGAQVLDGLTTALGLAVGAEGVVAARGTGQLGAVITSEANAAGGTVVTAAGRVLGSDFKGAVNSGLMRDGTVNILSGAHGDVSGAMSAERSFFNADRAMFGHLEGVHIFDITRMTPSQIGDMLRGPGTTIGAFCDSGACLAPFR